MTESSTSSDAGQARACGVEIIDSIDLPIMVVAPDCAVASFNRAAATFFSLGPSDVGRSLCEMPLLSNVKRLEELCGNAIARGASSQGEVRDATGSWFVLRIVPYWGSDQQIAGAVLTLTNVTALRASLDQAVYEREYTKAIVNTVIDPLVVLDEDLRIQTANHAFYAMFQLSREETQGVRLYDLGKPDWATGLRTFLTEAGGANGQFDPIELEHEFPTTGRRTVLLNARRLSPGGNLAQMTLLAIHDITERKQAEEALRRSEANLRDFVENASVGLHWVGPDGIILWANQTELDLLGYTRGEYIGHHIADFHVDQKTIEDILTRLTRAETLDGYEARLRCKDGSLRHVLISSNVLFEDGKFIHTRCFTRDITERKQAEEALRESEERYRTLFASAPMAVFVCDRNGVIQHYNQRAVELWGREPACGVEQHCGSVKLWLPDGTLLPHAQSPIMEVLRTGVPARNVEVFIERPDGSRLPVLVNFAALKNAQGKTIGAITSFMDITERKRTEEAVREGAERLRFMAESMPQKIFTAKPNGEIDYFNQQWSEFTGLSFEQIKGWGWTQFIHAADLAENVGQWKHSIDTGQPFCFEHRFRRKDGLYRWHLSRAHAMRDPQGKILIWIGSSTDIDDQKRQEERLEATVQQRTAKLQETVGHLEAFSYSIVHDMRAPLRAMHSFAKILDDDCGERVGQTGKDYIRRIITSAKRMDRLIQDVLTYSRVARTEFELAPVNLDTLLKGMLESYPMFQPPEAEIQVQGRLPEVMGNEASLTQCFSNLLSNAVKFVASGVTPNVRIWSEPSTLDGQASSKIFIQDNGIGIPKDAQEKIYGVFQRLSKDYEGTGIGLAIVQKAVERMGGRVGLDSEPGKGSIFWLELNAVDD